MRLQPATSAKFRPPQRLEYAALIGPRANHRRRREEVGARTCALLRVLARSLRTPRAAGRADGAQRTLQDAAWACTLRSSDANPICRRGGLFILTRSGDAFENRNKMLSLYTQNWNVSSN